MIIKLLLFPLWGVISLVISFIPTTWQENGSITGLVGMLSTAFQFFPSDVWTLAVGSFVFYTGLHFAYGVLNFIVSWIPFLNMGQK